MGVLWEIWKEQKFQQANRNARGEAESAQARSEPAGEGGASRPT